MSIDTSHRATQRLVDDATGLINREIFVNESIYQQEQEQIFARAWLLVGHESQIPNPGDYAASRMGEESVILTRDQESQVHVFLNTCRHRGMKVCRYDEGNAQVFTCPYHGWSFATDGQLIGVPHDKAAYRGQLDRSQWGLIEVAQLVNYKGSIWATWDPQAPPFLTYLGAMKDYLDLALDSRDGREGGSEIIGGVQKSVMSVNWKFAAENFAGDSYHNISHRSVDIVGIGPSGKNRRDTAERTQAPRVVTSVPEWGHGAVSFLQHDDLPYTPSFQNHPSVEAYYRDAYEKRQRALGPKARLLGLVGTVFPNMSYLARQPRSLVVWHPCGVAKTEVWRWTLIDRDAPQDVKDVMRHYAMRYSGPAGLTEQDDFENWHYAQSASKGVIARRHPYNYTMGLGITDPDYGIPGEVVMRISEQNQRGFYRRWAEMMDV